MIGGELYDGFFHRFTFAVVYLWNAEQPPLFIVRSVSHMDSEMFLIHLSPRALNLGRFFAVEMNCEVLRCICCQALNCLLSYESSRGCGMRSS